MNEQTNLTVSLEKDAERILKAESVKEQIVAVEEEGYDGFTGNTIKLIPTPNFSEAKSVGTMLPINMANETVTNLSLLAQEFDFIDFIKEKLGYSSRVKVVQCFASEQIDALVLAIKSFEKNNAFILGDMAGIGKGRSQPLDAKIVTPSGLKTMGDMKIGSEVFSVDGTVTKVVGVYPQGKIDVYEIVFSDGSKTQCSKDHLWNVLAGNQRVNMPQKKQLLQKNYKSKYYDTYKTKTLAELIEGGINKRYSIPMTSPVQFEYKETPIDPYLLGVLLGDACLRQHAIELTCADEEILTAVNSILPDELIAKKTRDIHYTISRKERKGGRQIEQYENGTLIKTWDDANAISESNSFSPSHIRHSAQNNASAYGYTWKYGKNKRKNHLLIALNDLNLAEKTAVDKFIPEIYKINSVEVRLAILQGLMDTDGYVSKEGNCIFTTISNQLAKDVQFLVQSLGGISKISVKKTTHKDAYNVSVKLPNGMIPCRLMRKAIRCRNRDKYPPMRMIRSINFIGQKECQCIKVAHHSSLYLTDEFIVTHNTCAGVLRYAYMQGMIPVFFTQKPYLLNDIYRDLMNIDGMGTNEKGQRIAPRPFVMHNEGVIVDREGNPIPTNQVYKTTYKNGEAIFRFVDNNNPYSINELCKAMTDEIERKGEAKLFKDFNSVMLPYSVISQSKSSIRRNFLSAIAPNAILVFDESHNAASANLSSNILRTGIPLVQACRGVLFSSATYAKNPNVFNLYVVKTALRTAVPSMDAITDALKVGGENVSEYIASGLVKEGQMIRRERSFGDCKKITEYVGSIRSEDGFGNTNYSDIPDDTQRAFYDEAIGYFKELRDFSKSEMSANAVDNAVLRAVAAMDKELANMEAYEVAKNAPNDRAEALRTQFIRSNRGKYIAEYSTDSISRYKATFRANLFLAIKAKFTADKIIECLNTPVQYTNTDGTTYSAPQKPIIAMANTGEAIFNELRLEEGQEVQNDFSEYLRAIYNKMFTGSFKLRRVDSNIFESTSSLSSRGVDFELLEGDFNVELSDFADGGAMITEIQGRLNSYTSELPFSVIDYLRDRIENAQRSPIYYGQNGIPLYGQASTPFYRFAEGTSRNYMLKRDENGVLRFQKNDRMKSTTKIFRAFNNGAVDVMLINVVASTGGSAQSSPEEGIDTRPRNMFIVQFELDINIEVQKRGRVNRTGQLNSPTYTYIITKIPVELRTYLMFRKKLRKLDANTSADQTASSKTSEITDSKGNPIEDIFNHYGFEVFKNDFIDLPDNLPYAEIFENMNWRSKINTGESGTAEEKEMNVEQFNSFVRELELYPAQFQEYFFDEMNEKYIQKKNLLLAQGEYQEELQAQNYKASLKQRVVIQLNSGTTVFSLPLFLSDYFTLESKRAWSKDRVNQKANELAVWDNQPVTPMEFYAKFVEDYIKESLIMQETLRKDLDEMTAPDPKDFPNTPEGKDKYERAVFMFEARKNAKLQAQRESINVMKSLIAFYKPYTKVSYEGNLGMFIGYKIKKANTRFKYTEGNIEFIFCFLSKYPTLHLKASSNKEALIDMRAITQMFLYSENKLAQSDRERIEEWKPNLNKRQIRRFLSGNILSGIVDANTRKKQGEFKSWALTRFTNIDGSISTAIELKFDKDLPDNALIRTTNQKLAVAADNQNIFDYIQQIPETTGTSFDTSTGVVRNQTIFPIWNVEGEKIIDRAVCIVRTEPFLRNAQGEGSYVNTLKFQVMQNYVVQEDKTTKQKLVKEIEKGQKSYNELYHDRDFEEMFSDFLLSKTPERTKIKYAFYSYRDEKGETRTKYNTYNVYIKEYQFKMTEVDSIKLFLTELYNKYGVMFNFRSDVADYFNVEAQSDTFDPSKKEQQVRAFPEGEYTYRFIRKVPESVIETIPYVLKRTYDGAYGGVITSQPIMPNMLPSFEMKPFRLGNEIYVKLTLSVLNDEDKTQFAKDLEELAEIKNEDAYTIGEYVRSFITQRSVGTTYFFGDLRITEYGSIFREYALKQDLEKLIIEERGEELVAEAKEVKTEVTLEDAENFVIKLWSLI